MPVLFMRAFENGAFDWQMQNAAIRDPPTGMACRAVASFSKIMVDTGRGRLIDVFGRPN